MNTALLQRKWRVLCAVCLTMLLSACAVQLAPPYDKFVADGIANVNVDAMSLFATVSAGTKPETFSNREDRYNTLIGKLDALVLHAGARPVPKSKAGDAVNKLLTARGIPGINDDDGSIPSATALKKVAETVAKMRDTDRKQGLTAFEALAFKGQAAVFLDQAITYENFLQR